MTTEKLIKRFYRHMSKGDLAEIAASLGNFSNTVPPPTLRGAGKVRKIKRNQQVAMVGAAGIEPPIPTMSTHSGWEPMSIFRRLESGKVANSR